VTGPRLLRLLVAVTLTAYIIWDTNPRAVARAAGRADLQWISSAVLLVFLDRGLMAWRWMDLLAALTPGSRPPFWTVLRIFFVSTFIGTFLPSRGGDVYRAYRLSRHDVRMSESAASVLMDRVLGVLSIVMVGAVALAAAPEMARDPWVLLSLAAAAVLCLSAGLAVFSARAAGIIQQTAGRLRSYRLAQITSAMTDAVRRYGQHHRELVRVLAVSVVVQSLRVLQAFCLGRAIGIDLPVSAFFVFIPIALLVMLLPITVNGLGTGQWAFVWLFGQAGVAASDAVALSLLFIALGIIGNLPGALLYAAGERPNR
jgi:uncharacterized protein (TIRG00374 family)